MRRRAAAGALLALLGYLLTDELLTRISNLEDRVQALISDHFPEDLP